MKTSAWTPLAMALACLQASNALAQSHAHHAPPAPATEKTATDSTPSAGHAPSTPAGEGSPAAGDVSHGHAMHGHAMPSAVVQVLPPITAADRAAAFPDLGGMTMAEHGMDDDALYVKVLADTLEWRRGETDGGDALGWNLSTWIGRDIDKLWLTSSGQRRDGRTGTLETRALWGHALGPWWDRVVGLRHQSRPGPARTDLALGIKGLAPYKFDIEAMMYLGQSGQVQWHLEAEYELLFTDRWILTPSLGTGLVGKDDPLRGTRSGWSGIETGLRLRYEIRPDLAPYAGYVWQGGGQVEEADKGGQWVAGLRFWF